MSLPLWADVLIAVLLLAGSAFALIGSFGLVKLSDFHRRLHGPTKATTLGVGSVLLASAVYFSVTGEGVSLHEALVTLFLFLTAPVSAHLLAKAAAHLDPEARPVLPDTGAGGREEGAAAQSGK